MKKIEWKQDLIGRYTSDEDEITVTSPQSLSFDMTDNATFWDYVDSVDELTIWLKSKGLPLLQFPTRTITDGWKFFGSDGSKHDTKSWCRSLASGKTEVLMLLNWNNGTFNVHLWDNGFEHPMHYETQVLRFVQIEDKNPETDLHVAIAEALSHGASGMDKKWYNVTLDEAEEVLKSLGVKIVKVNNDPKE
jgi:hypothetical protein